MSTPRKATPATPARKGGGTRLTFNAWVALAIAIIVSGFAMVSSVHALYAIGEAAVLPFPMVLPIVTDFLAIGAAVAIRRNKGDRLAWFTLLGCTAASTALQVAAAPADLVSQLVHAAPPLGSLLSFEMALRAMKPETAVSAPKRTTPAKATTVKAGPAKPATATTAPATAKVAARTPAKKAAPRKTTAPRGPLTTAPVSTLLLPGSNNFTKVAI